MTTIDNALHLKYRPNTLETLIGHKKAVATLKGIVEKNKWPNALLFTGPTSAGKTTMARALAGSFFQLKDGRSVRGHFDFTETNAADKRTIDDMRQLISDARYAPQQAKRKFFLVDECQMILSNAPASAVFLKALEEPSSTTTWLLASMEPEKFAQSSNGKAIMNRCMRIGLDAPSPEDLYEYAVRIIKGEKFSYHSKESVAALIKNCNSEMRTLAQLIELTDAQYVGESKEGKIDASYISEVVVSTESEDDVLAVRLLTAIYAKKLTAATLACLDITDHFGFVKKLLWMNEYVLAQCALRGRTHPKVWSNKNNKILLEQVLGHNLEEKTLFSYAHTINTAISDLVVRSATFQVPERAALFAFVDSTIKKLS